MGTAQKLTAFESMHEEGNELKLQEHYDHHFLRGGAKAFICYLEDCDIHPVTYGSIEVIAKEIQICTKKEFDILMKKNFLDDYNEREQKLILGDRKVE